MSGSSFTGSSMCMSNMMMSTGSLNSVLEMSPRSSSLSRRHSASSAIVSGGRHHQYHHPSHQYHSNHPHNTIPHPGTGVSGHQSRSSSRQASRNGSRHGSRSGSRPSSRNGGNLANGFPAFLPYSKPSSRQTSRPSSTHGSRAGSRRGSLGDINAAAMTMTMTMAHTNSTNSCTLVSASPLFVAGKDEYDIETFEDFVRSKKKRRSRAQSNHDDRGDDTSDSDEEGEEESNTSLPAHGANGHDMNSMDLGSTGEEELHTSNDDDSNAHETLSDGDGETLSSLRSIPKNRLRVSTSNIDNESTGNAANTSGVTSNPPFRIPSLSLPTPTSAGGQRGNSNQGQERSKFMSLKLVCPSPDHQHRLPLPPMSKEDKLLYFSRQCSILTDSLCVASRLIAQDWQMFIRHGITHVINCAGDICENYFESIRFQSDADEVENDGHDSNLASASPSSHNILAQPIRQTRSIKYLRLFLLDAQDEDLLCVLYPVIEFIESARREEPVQLSPYEMAVKLALLANGTTAPGASSSSSRTSSDEPSSLATETPSHAQPLSSTIPSRILVHCQQGVSRSTALCIAYLMLTTHRDYEEAYTLVRSIRGICRPNFGFISQLKSWKQRLDGAHTQPLLYRVTPHCSRDRRIVIKLVDRLNDHCMDSRTIFIFVTRAFILVWIGARVLPQQEMCYMRQVRHHIANLRKYEHAPTSPAAEFVVRQTQEQAWIRHHADYYVVRDPSLDSSTSTSVNGSMTPRSGVLEVFERSPSQVRFLATLMSPNTLKSLNLAPPTPTQASASATTIPTPSSAATPRSSSSQTSPLLTSSTPPKNSHLCSPLQSTTSLSARSRSVSPMMSHRTLASASGGALSNAIGNSMTSPSRPPAYPSATSTGISPSSSLTSGLNLSTSLVRPPSVLSIQASTTPPARHDSGSSSTPLSASPTDLPSTWQEASRAFWSVLNATPQHELTVADYDDDYPTHEWMAMHLASEGMRKTRTTASSSSNISRSVRTRQADTGVHHGSDNPGTTMGAGASSSGSSSTPAHSRPQRSSRMSLRRRSSAASTSASAAAAAAAAAAVSSVTAASVSTSATAHDPTSMKFSFLSSATPPLTSDEDENMETLASAKPIGNNVAHTGGAIARPSSTSAPIPIPTSTTFTRPPRLRHQLSISYYGDDDDDEDVNMNASNIGDGYSPSETVPSGSLPRDLTMLPLSTRLHLRTSDADDVDDDDDDDDGDVDDADGSLTDDGYAANERESTEFDFFLPSAHGPRLDRLNPLMIGLNDPVPAGFVANSTNRYYEHDDTSESSEGERSPNIRLRSHSFALPSLPTAVPPCDDPSDIRRQQSLNRDESLAPTQEHLNGDDVVTNPSVPLPTNTPSSTRFKMVPRLYSYPELDEVTCFDYDDLKSDSVLLLEWRPQPRRNRSRRHHRSNFSSPLGNGDHDDDDDDDDDEDVEVPEVRNLRLRAAGRLTDLASPVTRSAVISPLQDGEPQLSQDSNSSVTPPSIVHSAIPIANDADPSATPSPVYHVWFGKLANLTDSMSDDQRRIAANKIVDEFCKGTQNESVDVTTTPPSAVKDVPAIHIELDGLESDLFHKAFEV